MNRDQENITELKSSNSATTIASMSTAGGQGMNTGTVIQKEIELSGSLENLQNAGNQIPTNYSTISLGLELLQSSEKKKNKNRDRQETKVDEDKWTFSIPSKDIRLAYPQTKDLELDLAINNTSRAQTTDFLGWNFNHQRTNWSLSSKNILTVTYTPVSNALPSFTRKHIGVDYIQRVFKRSKCSKTICGKGKNIHEEVYTADDIQSVIFLDENDINVKGYHNHDCHGLQISLRSKTGTKRRFPPSPLSEGTYDGDGNGRDNLPSDGHEVLKENGYLAEETEGMEDGIPLPPWRKPIDPNSSDDDRNDAVYGPVVTFLMPNVKSSSDEIIEMAPPLLWKVQFPPDPSVALEAFTVLDGCLDVHPDEFDDGDLSESNSNSNSYSDSECSALHPTNIYLNGYQSWSFAGSVTQGDEQPKSAMPNFLSKAFNYGADIPPAPTEEEDWVHSDDIRDSERTRTRTRGARDGSYLRKWKRKASCQNDDDVKSNKSDIEGRNFRDLKYYKSDFYTCVSCNVGEEDRYNDTGTHTGDGDGEQLDENGGPAMVLGYLSQRRQYGLVTFDSDLYSVAMHSSLQGVVASKSTGISTDWAYCQILSGDCYDEEPMAHYLNAVSAYNFSRPLQNFPPLTGWCSWYHYYENIDSANLKDNFKELADLKSKITSDAVIIDDGYMTSWGDWDSLKPKGFPENSGGMKSLAESISSHEMIPGLWLAPYACDKNSKLAKEHPDWIIRNDEGRIANSSNCGKFFYGLDATNPAVREYAFNIIRRAVRQWGYKVLKLDFLYAACLTGNGKYDLTMTRAETMYLALQTLRAAAGPDTFIIGCGCPIGPAIGLVDANRISADTGPTWYPDFPLPWWDHATLPSLRAMIRNTITRSCVGHRFWHNDPDCILLGDTTRLTESEVKSAATVIAMTGGMLLLSDDLSKLSSERLRVASRIFPVTGVTGITLDLHNTSESGIPSLLRLWCSDEIKTDFTSMNAVEMASRNAKRTSFSPRNPLENLSDRKRNCIPVAKGLGTWIILSLSNWLDKPADVSVPFSASLPTSNVVEAGDIHLGYHVFSFWMSKYAWVSANQTGKNIRKKLGPHESEIFHVKAVSLDRGQYIGSELHFTCGYEIVSFHSTSTYIDLQLRNDLKRSGFIYLYLPCYSNSMKVTMSGMTVRGEVVFRTPKIGHKNNFYGGQVIRVWAVVSGNGSTDDGRIVVKT